MFSSHVRIYRHFSPYRVDVQMVKHVLVLVLAVLSCSTYLLVDPCEKEEQVMDGLLVIAMNKHREICFIQSSGGIMLLKDQVEEGCVCVCVECECERAREGQMDRQGEREGILTDREKGREKDGWTEGERGRVGELTDREREGQKTD